MMSGGEMTNMAVRSRWPLYEDDEISAVSDVLRSGRVNSLVHGDKCRAFETAFANFCGMPHAISLANGTLALELALRESGRAHVCTPVTNAQLVCRLRLEKQ